MSSEFVEMAENNKLNKLLTGREPTTKEAKETLNKLAIYSASYAFLLLRDVSINKEITKEEIDKVFESLKKEL
ncbi:hypothetical protein NUSPORA_00058 [Nucleospora cyclopteri]